jgi:tetratricopeptide (TPR) repeat protein/DNA-binding CsgD family transcriptional regulator
MKNNEFNFSQNIAIKYLISIKDVKFTRREVDIISCLLNGRSTKTIASFLEVTPRTIETHIRNIMLKLACHSPENIIGFVERSDQYSAIKKHYENLLIYDFFKKNLKEIFTLIHPESPVCYLFYTYVQDDELAIIHQITDHLRFTGFKIISTKISPENIIDDFMQQEFPDIKHVIFILSEDWIECLQTEDNKKNLTHFKMIQKALKIPGFLTLILLNDNDEHLPPEFHRINPINFAAREQYYLSFFDLLKRILPDINLDKSIAEFKERYISIHDSTAEREWPDIKSQGIKIEKTPNISSHFFKGSNWKLITISLLIVIATISVTFWGRKGDNERDISKKNEIKPVNSIRSDLVIPSENIRLNRFLLISKLNEKFKGDKRIQTLVLIGIGGAGKTTLARQYSQQQNANIVWEVNAETQENLKESFEQLGYALCKSEEEKKILRGLQNIKDSTEREEEILFFVKKKLKLHSDWILIFDNVEKFTDIQKYFPHDYNVWGRGKVIITTRNSNLKNSHYISHAIQVGELNSAEKMQLFSKIMNNSTTTSFTSLQQKQAQKFLNSIPSFPLDISVAAYYLKATNISYEKYLKNLNEYNKEFSNIHENILREENKNAKTRHSIIVLSLKNILEVQKEFIDLLLLISLIDSQNIPRFLLDSYKNSTKVDNFIYHLKKYSLITNESAPHSIPTFSIHRSTQAISLSYLTKTMSLEKNDQYLKKLVKFLEHYIADVIDKEDFSSMKILANHCEAFLNHTHLLTDTIKGSIGSALGCIYYYLSYNTKAKYILEESLTNLNKNYGENYNRIARTLMYLGNVYRALGDCQKAKDLLEQSLTIYNKHPKNHMGTAKSLGYLGIVYRGLGNYTKAKDLLEQSLGIYIKYSENHIGHAWILAHLGNTYMILGDYKEAKNLLEQSLKIYKNYSENYVGVSWVLGYLGNVYREIGDYEKAKKILEQSLIICRKHFPENHVYVASSLAYLGRIYGEMGDYTKAKNLLKKSLATYEDNYGKDHIETIRVLESLGQVYCLEGHFDKGEALIKQALQVLQLKKYSESYIPLENLAKLYIKKHTQMLNKGNEQQSQEFKEKATAYLKQALAILRKSFPENSWHISRIQNELKNFK